MFRFSDINVEIQGENEMSVTEKIILDGKEMRENINDTENEKEFASDEDPLNMHRTASNEETLITETPDIINEEKLSLHQGKEKISILIDEFV